MAGCRLCRAGRWHQQAEALSKFHRYNKYLLNKCMLSNKCFKPFRRLNSSSETPLFRNVYVLACIDIQKVWNAIFTVDNENITVNNVVDI